MFDGVYPDFMEKLDKPMRQSDGILGQLYRDIKKEEQLALEVFKRFDYDKSIKLSYNLD